MTAFAADLAVVVTFVVVGRRNHHADAGWDGFVRVAWPFVVALVIGWLAARTARAPFSWVLAAPVALATAWGGVGLRIVAQGRDLRPSFVIVSTIWFVALMLGWRVALGRFRRTRAVEVSSRRRTR